jgi:hypothetical protein
MSSLDGCLRNARIHVDAGTEGNFFLQTELGHNQAALAFAKRYIYGKRLADGLGNQGSVSDFGIGQQGAQTLD